MVTCWECGAETSQPMTVMLRLPSGPSRSFKLCASCYRDLYLPLISEMAGGGDTQTPSDPSKAGRGRRGEPHAN